MTKGRGGISEAVFLSTQVGRNLAFEVKDYLWIGARKVQARSEAQRQNNVQVKREEYCMGVDMVRSICRKSF